MLGVTRRTCCNICLVAVLQTFRALIDGVGLYKSKQQKKPVEFMTDWKLDFQDYSKLRAITVSIAKSGMKPTKGYIVG